MDCELAIESLPHAFGPPAESCIFKKHPEDFCVVEDLGFELSGEGEHLFLQVKKNGLNTEQVAKQLAHLYDVPNRSVTYAGLKDKFAVTTQYFGVHLPGKPSKDERYEGVREFDVLKAKRHHKKLKIGYLKGNDFTIRLRDVCGSHQTLEQRLNKVEQGGVPNYFGPQRFGRGGQNLIQAEQVLLHGKKIKNRFLKGMIYSSARAFLFNQMLAARVSDESWRTPLVGDVMQLAGSKSFFHVDDIDDALVKRIECFDVSPAVPLWGEGKLLMSHEAKNIVEESLMPWCSWCEALEKQGLKLAYRPLILAPDKLTWQWEGNDLLIQFYLPSGAYATAVLRELLITNTPQ